MIKKLKNQGNDEKSAPQARQKIGYFGVFFRFFVVIPPLVIDRSETRGGITTRNTIDRNANSRNSIENLGITSTHDFGDLELY